MIWTGSDDGLVHVTRDGGESWDDVTPAGMPEWMQINCLEAHPTEPGGAYIAGTRYKLDDFKPYLYKTTDYGQSWQRIDAGIDRKHFTRAIRADQHRPGLLYAGTESGLYISFDDGISWESFQCNLPIVPITDLALKDKDLAEKCQSILIITEGFTTYGGLSGRDMEVIATGLEEVFDPHYLEYRIGSTAYLGEHLHKLGVPLMRPVGGHAVYIDARKFYPHIPVDQYPGQSLVCELYLRGGVRSVEVGSVMFGKYDEQHNLIPAAMDLVRLAIPRRVYTQSHIEYVIETFAAMMQDRDNVGGYEIIEEQHFLRQLHERLR